MFCKAEQHMLLDATVKTKAFIIVVVIIFGPTLLRYYYIPMQMRLLVD